MGERMDRWIDGRNRSIGLYRLYGGGEGELKTRARGRGKRRKKRRRRGSSVSKGADELERDGSRGREEGGMSQRAWREQLPWRYGPREIRRVHRAGTAAS